MTKFRTPTPVSSSKEHTIKLVNNESNRVMANTRNDNTTFLSFVKNCYEKTTTAAVRQRNGPRRRCTTVGHTVIQESTGTHHEVRAKRFLTVKSVVDRTRKQKHKMKEINFL